MCLQIFNFTREKFSLPSLPFHFWPPTKELNLIVASYEEVKIELGKKQLTLLGRLQYSRATEKGRKVGAEQGAEDTSRAARSACFFSSCDSPRFARFFLFRVFRRVALASFLRVFRRVALASFLRVFRRVSHHHHLSLLLVCVEHGLKRGHELERSGVLAFDVLNTRLGRVSLASARHVWSTD